MIMLDLFSGIGGFTKGFMDAGWKFDKHYYSDIDKHANAVYKYNFPEAEYVGDVRTIQGIERPNIITFGSPCQDFSLAGKRKGLDGNRSSLIRAAITLIKKYKPDLFIWENVKGVFSSNDGADFWAVIQAFANIGDYRLEWQLLNTAWFLPQNRERIYLIGHLGEGSGSKVFPIGESDSIGNGTQGTPGDDRNGIRSGHPARGSNINNSENRRSRQGYVNKDISAIIIKSNTKKGYEEAEQGDSIDLKSNGSKTRRAVVGKRKAHSLDTASNQAVITHYGHKDKEATFHKLSPTLKAQSHGHETMIRDGRDNRSCIRAGRTPEIGYSGQSIRRLTPIECERLQGFSDNWTRYGIFENSSVKEISDSQRYKMCGNAVSIPPVRTIAERLK